MSAAVLKGLNAQLDELGIMPENWDGQGGCGPGSRLYRADAGVFEALGF
jgi:hypothetical protein